MSGPALGSLSGSDGRVPCVLPCRVPLLLVWVRGCAWRECKSSPLARRNATIHPGERSRPYGCTCICISPALGGFPTSHKGRVGRHHWCGRLVPGRVPRLLLSGA